MKNLSNLKRAALIFLICFVVSFLYSFIVAFFTAQAPKELSQNSQPAPIELTIWTLQLSDFKDYLNGVFREFEAQHPGVKVTWVDIPFSEGEKKALTAILSKHAPDVMNLNPDFSAILSSKGTLIDMNTMLTPQEKASYLPVAWQACSLRDPKQTFGLPWYLTSAVTYSNRALLKQAGLQTAPKTEADLLKLAEVLKKTGQADAFFPTLAENGRFLKMLHQEGIPIQDEVGRYVFAKHGAGKALASWVNLYSKGYLPKEALTQGHQDVMDRYQSGSLAMFVAGTTALGSIQKNAPAVYQQTQVSRQFPEHAGQVSNPDFSVMTLVVPKTTEHPKEAVALALALTNAKNTLVFSKLAPILPPNTTALEQSIAKTRHSDLLEEARYLSATQLLHSKNAFQIHPRQKSVNQIMDFYVQSALLGKLSSEDAMQQAQDKINQALKN